MLESLKSLDEQPPIILYFKMFVVSINLCIRSPNISKGFKLGCLLLLFLINFVYLITVSHMEGLWHTQHDQEDDKESA